MDSVGCRRFKIPPRSPDLNPIKNMFHLIGKHLKKLLLLKTWNIKLNEKFSRRAKKTVLNFPLDIINRTIESMPTRIDQVIKMNKQPTKY